MKFSVQQLAGMLRKAKFLGPSLRIPESVGLGGTRSESEVRNPRTTFRDIVSSFSG